MTAYPGIEIKQIQADISQKLLEIIVSSSTDETLKIIKGLVERLDPGFLRDFLSIIEMLEKEKSPTDGTTEYPVSTH